MLIAGDPTQMLETALRFRTSRARLLSAAADLRGLGLPEMPPAVAAQVGAALPRIAHQLEQEAHELDERARDLANRALWVIVAGIAGLKTPPLSAGRGAWGIFSSSLKIAEQRRLMRMLRAWDLYTTEVMPWALRGRTASLAAVNSWMLWQQEISQFTPASRLPAILAGEGDAAYYLRVVSGPLRGFRGVAGRVTPFLAIATSGDTMLRGSSLPGWRGDVDRYVAAPLGLGVGAFGAGAAVGVIALTPPGEVALAVVAIGVGAWAVGNVVYDNRHAIAKAVVGGAKWVDHHHEVLYGVPGVGEGLAVYDHRHDIANGVVAGAEWSKDRLSDAGHVLVSGGGTVVHGVTSTPGKVADGFKKLGGLFH